MQQQQQIPVSARFVPPTPRVPKPLQQLSTAGTLVPPRSSLAPVSINQTDQTAPASSVSTPETKKIHYPNGKLAIEHGLDAQGRIHGHLREYGEDGELMKQIGYSHGQFNGIYMLFYPKAGTENRVRWSGTYKDGVSVGCFRHYAPDGHLLDTMTFDDRGRKHGDEVSSWPAPWNSTKTELQWKHGKLHGVCYWMHPIVEEDRVAVMATYKDGILCGAFATFDLKGKKMVEIVYDEQGRRHGKCVTRRPNGVKETLYHFHHGVLHGGGRTWYENGQVEWDFSYNHGKQSGLWRHYGPDGMIRWHSRYDQQGRLHGKRRLYAQTSGLHPHAAEYVEGKLHGALYSAWPDGKAMKLKAKYDQGQLHGAYQVWNQEGVEFQSGFYTNGKRSGTWIERYPSGKLRCVANFKDGKVDGEVVMYHEKGYANVIRLYIDDKPVGIVMKRTKSGYMEEHGWYNPAGEYQLVKQGENQSRKRKRSEASRSASTADDDATEVSTTTTTTTTTTTSSSSTSDQQSADQAHVGQITIAPSPLEDLLDHLDAHMTTSSGKDSRRSVLNSKGVEPPRKRIRKRSAKAQEATTADGTDPYAFLDEPADQSTANS